MKMKISGLAIAAALFGTCLPVIASEATSDGFPPAQNLDYTHLPGADQDTDGGAAPLGGNNFYLFVAGSAFTPRTSAQSVTYPGAGCSTSTNGITTSLQLPDGAEVQGVRLFYYNNGTPGSAVGLFLTAYTGVGGINDLLTGTSTQTTGYTSEFFAAPSALVIDNANQSYVLTATMGASVRFCGIRVFYIP